MKYLKSYSKIFESTNSQIEDEALRLGFTIDNEHPRSLILKIDTDYKLTIIEDRYYLSGPSLQLFVGTLSNQIKLYTDLSPVKRAIAICKYIIQYESLGNEIDSNVDLQDILVNFTDRGYDIVFKKWGFMTQHEHTSYGKIPSLSFNWKYVIRFKTEGQAKEVIENDFKLFNYLKSFGLGAELVLYNNKNYITILIDKV